MAGPSSTEIRNAYEQAARWFVDTVPQESDRWEAPALGEWTVRDLVGHTSRALLTVETYLDKPAAAAELSSAGDYFRRIAAASGDPVAVAQRGRDAGTALGDDPAAAVIAIADRVLPKLYASADDVLVTTPAGGMRLIDYLPTRTFELTVHTSDLNAALDLPMEPPAIAARESLAIISELATTNGQAAPLLLATTGRQPLPNGYTVL